MSLFSRLQSFRGRSAIPIFIPLLIVVASAALTLARTWTDRTGRRVEADLIESTGDRATLQRISDGKLFSFPLEKLSDDDQQFVRTQAAKKPSTPPISVRENPAANGWNVQVSFRHAPTSFGRAAQVWTLDEAQAAAERLRQDHANVDENLSVAEIRIEGKDGDGETRPDQGPHLPDWPIVEQQFRARTKTKSAELDQKLADVKVAYEQAAKQTEQVLRDRQPISTQKEKALQALAEQFNAQADELDRVFFNNRPQPLPRLKMPAPQDIYDHSQDWVNSMRLQYQAERLGKEVRVQKSDLAQFEAEAFQNRQVQEPKTGGKKIEFDDAQTKTQGKPDAQGNDKVTENKQAELDRVRQAVRQKFNALDNLLVDSSRIAPSADVFAASPGGAIYTSVPRVEIRKTDAQGNDLADDQQPQGYPKPFLGGVTLQPGEKLFVDPSLRVELIAKLPGQEAAEVRAGVYGKVTAVDAAAGKLAVQVDTKGTQIVMLGIQPQGVKVGDYVEPARTVGTVRPTRQRPKNFDFVIRAINANNRLVSPGIVLDYGSRRPTTPGQLKRDIPEGDAAELPVKKGSAADSSKPEDQSRVVFDDAAEKGANLKQATADELNAKRELANAKDRESKQVDQVGELASKSRQVESELKQAQEQLRTIETAGPQVLREVEAMAKRKSTLADELKFLTDNKQTLEDLAARAKASQNAAEIDAFNDKAKGQNERLKKLVAAEAAVRNEEASLSAKIAELQRDRTKQQKLAMELQQEQTSLETKSKAAQAELEQARADVKSKETALQTIAAEKTRLIEQQALAQKALAQKEAAAQSAANGKDDPTDKPKTGR